MNAVGELVVRKAREQSIMITCLPCSTASWTMLGMASLNVMTRAAGAGNGTILATTTRAFGASSTIWLSEVSSRIYVVPADVREDDVRIPVERRIRHDVVALRDPPGERSPPRRSDSQFGAEQVTILSVLDRPGIERAII